MDDTTQSFPFFFSLIMSGWRYYYNTNGKNGFTGLNPSYAKLFYT